MAISLMKLTDLVQAEQRQSVTQTVERLMACGIVQIIDAALIDDNDCLSLAVSDPGLSEALRLALVWLPSISMAGPTWLHWNQRRSQV